MRARRHGDRGVRRAWRAVREAGRVFLPGGRPAAGEAATASLVSLGKVYAELDSSFASVKVLLVDACRNDPGPEGGRNGIDADNAPRPPSGVAALFSCRAGEKAFEHAKYEHGVFFHHLLQGLKGEAKNTKGNVTFHSLAEYVQEQVAVDVPKLIGGGAHQSPNMKADLSGPSLTLIAEAVAAVAEDALVREMKFVRVPKGTFWMGWDSDKKESKQVTIEQDFELAAYTVTQEQWRIVLGDNPSYFSRQGKGSDKVAEVSEADLKRFPVEQVSWDDTQKFLEKLNAREQGKGWKYRLPKEAEWEYACRGAATTKQECSFDFYLAEPTNDLSSKQANFHGEYPAGNGVKGLYLARPTLVGKYAPNKMGLYDMHGNVWQWCEDLDAGTVAVLRGGCWHSEGQRCRAAYRNGRSPSYRSYDLGFRLARVPSSLKE